jgi:hypothetical protein
MLNVDSQDEQTKLYIQSNENIPTEVNNLATFQFYRLVENVTAENYHVSNGIIYTPNNFLENDIDYYYNISDKIIEKNKWTEFSPPEMEKNQITNIEEPDQTDNLIDELFDSIQNN